MATMVETIFSVKEKPWHGLGEIIQDAPTSEDAGGPGYPVPYL